VIPPRKNRRQPRTDDKALRENRRLSLYRRTNPLYRTLVVHFVTIRSRQREVATWLSAAPLDTLGFIQHIASGYATQDQRLNQSSRSTVDVQGGGDITFF
jgi:hypothetical protein